MRDTLPSAKDLFEIRALAKMRRFQRHSIERWSRTTWVPFLPSRAGQCEFVRARERFGADVPEPLFAPTRLPAEGRLGLLYVLPYYGLAKLAFEFHRRSPINRAIPWQHDASWEPSFPDNGEGWRGGESDDEYVRLRLEGPNPFLLRRERDGSFALDLSSPFEGLGRGATARFELTPKGLRPKAIVIGDTNIAPSDSRFRWAKRVVNALDARYSIFAQHLGVVHLLVAQAYALAGASLPREHPLHSVLLAHTRGVLEVNEYAYQLLFSPASYFSQSGFFDRPSALRLIGTRLSKFRLEELMAPRDLESRGVESIPGHRWAHEMGTVWSLFQDHAREHVSMLYASDDALREDEELVRFYRTLVELLPRVPDELRMLESREQLAMMLAILLSLAPMHEISGDYSPFALAKDLEQKRIVRWDSLECEDSVPSFHDVFLFEQGAYTGLSNAAGNSMMDAPIERDPRLKHKFVHTWLERLRARLRDYECGLAGRDARWAHPLRRMYPRQWELSVSF